ncbi:MAG TPA: tetratricopeptide repeat protein [Kofleriaceae bacterium]|nr:tetratricopeptide repeat protein [Kofleriaceae bacterium]
MKHALAIVLVCVPLAARAQPASAQKGDAQSLMQSGVKLLETKDYLGALAVFKTAYERFQSAKILLNIGTTLKLLGRDADAANVYQRYLDAHDTDPKRRPEIEKLIAQIDKTVGRIALTVTPSDAQTHLDDDDWLHVVHAATWRVSPGKHSLDVHRDGYEAKTQLVEVAAGDRVAVEIALDAVPKPEPTVITVPVAVGVRATPIIEEPRSRLGALVFGHFDVPHGGAALVGVTSDLGDRYAVRAAAILGPHFGGYVGGVAAFLTHRYRPYVSAGVPVFYSNGARYGVRGAGGFEYELNRHLALSIEAGVEHTFNTEMDVKATVFVPALGVIGRL